MLSRMGLGLGGLTRGQGVGVSPPAGFGWLQLNGKNLTLNGKNLMLENT